MGGTALIEFLAGFLQTALPIGALIGLGVLILRWIDRDRPDDHK
jgi:hypothetical protein